MRHYGHHRCYHGKPGDGLIALLIIAAVYIAAMPFVGAYKLATGKDEATKNNWSSNACDRNCNLYSGIN